MSANAHPQPQTDMPKLNRYQKALAEEQRAALDEFYQARMRVEILDRLILAVNKLRVSKTPKRPPRSQTTQGQGDAA